LRRAVAKARAASALPGLEATKAAIAGCQKTSITRAAASSNAIA
jgi:hypothetical protein